MLMKLLKKTLKSLKKKFNLNKILNKIGEDDDNDDKKVLEFEFFTGGKNPKLDKYIPNFGLTSDNLEFLDFIQSEYCKEILENNNLKIHIETGNIYHKNADTNKSVFDFFKNQQNSSKGDIKFDFIFARNYDNHFPSIIEGFDSYEKNK